MPDIPDARRETVALILAGGSGSRLKAGDNKALIELGGRVLVDYSLEIYNLSPCIDRIILVIREEDNERYDRLQLKKRYPKLMGITLGGERRQDSVEAGLVFLQKHVLSKLEESEKILIVTQNAANPFVTLLEIERVVWLALRHGAATVEHPIHGTVKRIEGYHIVETLNRLEHCVTETPQAIWFEWLYAGLTRAAAHGMNFTDDVQVAEYIGMTAQRVPASWENRKLTVPEEIPWFKYVLAERLAKHVC